MPRSAGTFEERLLTRARSFGATLAGISRAEAVAASPSSRGLIPAFSGVGSAAWEESSAWAEGADHPADTVGDQETLLFPGGAVVVFALAHPKDEPALDWWGVPGGTEGNRVLMDIGQNLAAWLAKEAGAAARDLPYYPEKGGAFLKDAAVLAGLGCIGKNNLLVTPDCGPRVRLRGLAVDAPLTPTGPLWPDPCDGCREPCRRACPQSAFDRVVHSSVSLGTLTLPGRTGCFDRDACNRQMETDEASSPDGLVRYCRLCESACIAGR